MQQRPKWPYLYFSEALEFYLRVFSPVSILKCETAKMKLAKNIKIILSRTILYDVNILSNTYVIYVFENFLRSPLNIIAFLMRTSKITNVQDKQVDCNSDGVSYLTCKTIKFLTILAHKLHFFGYTATSLTSAFLKDRNTKQFFKQY